MRNRGDKNLLKQPFLHVLTVSLIFSQTVSLVALANPQGATVVHGDVNIQQTAPHQLTIQQNSPQAIINWQSFSIDAHEHTHFAQPSAAAKALNRVTGADPSSILGRLTSTGQVFLVNPNGILFGAGAKVDVGGLTAAAGNISDDDFLAGRNVFNNTPNGIVENLGAITAINGGSVVLQGDHVVNVGEIIANGGTVLLGGGQSVYQLGLVDVSSAGNGTGTVHIQADIDGYVELDGNIYAASVYEGEIGGQVTATGGTLKMLGGHINADGHSGGGTVLLGGDVQGLGQLPNAQHVFAGPEALITANALKQGDGGKIVLWADQETIFQGQLQAKGGEQMGNGGFAEVSGKQNLIYTGMADLSARALDGERGHLLLDPQNITIASLSFDPSVIANLVQWLDPDSSVSLNGSKITQLTDKESGTGNERAYESNNNKRPTLDSGALNGRDAALFDGADDQLLVANDNHINNINTLERSMVIVFRTSNDITRDQVVYEEGNQTNGTSFYIDNGQFYIGAWSTTNSAGSFFASEAIQVNTTYVATMVWDGTNRIYRAYLNGDQVDGDFTIGNDGQLRAHNTQVRFARNHGNTKRHDGNRNHANYFEGHIGESALFNKALTTTERQNMEQYMALRWGTTLNAPGQDYTFSLETLEAQLANANITLMAEDNITINDIADNSLDLNMTAGGSIHFLADNNGDGVGTISMDASDRIVTQGGDMTFTGANIELAELVSNGGNIELNASNNASVNTANAGSGNFTANVDTDNNGNSTASIGDVTANTITLNGSAGGGDTAEFTGAPAPGAGGLVLNNIDTIALNNADIDLNDINWSQNVTVAGNSTIDAATGNITFGNTVNGAGGLALTANNGNINLQGAVGGSTALNSLNVTAQNAIVGNVKTTGTQIYNAAASVNGTIQASEISWNEDVTLTANSTFISTGGDVIANGNVNGAHNLTLNASDDIDFNGALGNIAAIKELNITAADNANFDSTLDAGSVILNAARATFNGVIGANRAPGTFTVNKIDNLTFAKAVNVGDFTQSAGTGITRFNGAGLLASGDVTLNSRRLLGTVRANNLVMNASEVAQLAINSNTLRAGGNSAVLTGTLNGQVGIPAAALAEKVGAGTGLFTLNGIPFPLTPEFERLEVLDNLSGDAPRVINSVGRIAQSRGDGNATVAKSAAGNSVQNVNNAVFEQVNTEFNNQRTPAVGTLNPFAAPRQLMQRDGNLPAGMSEQGMLVDFWRPTLEVDDDLNFSRPIQLDDDLEFYTPTADNDEIAYLQ